MNSRLSARDKKKRGRKEKSFIQRTKVFLISITFRTFKPFRKILKSGIGINVAG